MKKKVLCLLLAVFITVASFAEEKNNAVFVDFGSIISGVFSGGFGLGLGYERGLTDNFSALFVASYLGFSNEILSIEFDSTVISVGLAGRYYPLTNPVSGWFIDVGGIYSYINMSYDGEEATSNIFELRLLTGWKIVFNSGFFLEPGVRYTVVLGDINYPSGTSDSAASIGGLSYFLGIGWAF